MRVLVVEDDPQTATYIRDGLTDAGWQVDLAEDGEAGLQMAGDPLSFDVLVIDRLLPRLDGLSLLNALRGCDVRTPALFLTALSAIVDRVEGLEGGADDYLVKPYAPEELDARIDVLVRRANVARTHVLRFGRLDLIQETSEVLLDGKRLDMSPREFELLFILMRAAPRLVPKRALVDALSERNLDLNDAAAELYVSRLRKKLEGTGTGIRTLRGVGYQLAIVAPTPNRAPEKPE